MQTREETLRYLKSTRDGLIEQMGKLEENVEHLNATISLLEKEMLAQSPPVSAIPEFPIGRLRNMTQLQAVIAIAKHNGGTVKAQDAKRLMIRANVMRETKNSTNITHNVIIRSEKFERVGPGEYRLKELRPRTAEGDGFRTPVQ